MPRTGVSGFRAWCTWTAVFLAAGGVLWSQGGAPQSPAASPQAPVFRSGVNFVSVDVYPRRDGKVVEGLRAEDFQVFEDGKPQKVETFEFIKIEPNPVDSDRRDPSSQAEGDRLARDPKNRLFVVYLDLAHTTISGSHNSQQPVVDFLTRTIGQTDLFGFMTAELPVGQLAFGRRTEAIEAQLSKFWTWGQADRIAMPRTPAEQRVVECALMFETRNQGRGMEQLLLQLFREEQLQTSLENLMLRLRDLRDERKNVLFISEGWVPRGPRTELMNASVSQGDLPPIGVGPGGRIGLGQTGQTFNSDYSQCDAIIQRLAGIDFEKRFRDLLTQARNANVTFYPVDVGGLKVNSPVGGARDTLLTLADNTDGFAVVNTNDLQAGVRRVADDLSMFYLLGYYSTNSAADGRFRRIEVKVAEPRLNVSARRGYVAPRASEMARPSAAPAGPSAVDDALGRLAVIRDATDVFVSGTAGPAGLDVVVELSSAAMARPDWQRGGEVRFTASRSGGSPVTGTVAIAPGERGARATLPVDEPMRGPWSVSARLTGPDGPVEAQAEIATPPATLVGMPSAWRGTPSPRVPLKPLADFRLTRTERLRVEWPLLQPSDTRTARLLDRRGQPLGAALPFATPPADRQVLAVDLPVSALPEGDYVVELVVARAEVNERRLLAFRVVR